MMAMKKLTRKWKQSLNRERPDDQKFSVPPTLDDDSHPIDTQEQEDLVRSFEKSQAKQGFLWRSVFSGLLFSFAAFFVYSIYHQASYPWELQYRAYFMDEIDSRMVILADWVAVLSCLMSIVGLLYNTENRRRWFWCSCAVGILLAMFWLYYMLRMPKFRWHVIWLPLGPLSGAGICLYIDHLLLGSSEEVRKLRSYMYSYKAI